LDRELDATRTALQQERERSAAVSRGGQEAERQLASEREARARVQEQLAQAQSPEANIPIVYLNAERGAGGEPSNRLRLTPNGSIVLSLEVGQPYYPSYQAIVRDAQGREILRVAGLRLDDKDALSFRLHSATLAPGDYTLAVEGLASGRRPAAAGTFSFRVLPPA